MWMRPRGRGEKERSFVDDATVEMRWVVPSVDKAALTRVVGADEAAGRGEQEPPL